MSDYSIEQLEDLTGFARRTIRYYIQQGLVAPPFGARKTPSYTQQHVQQLLQIKKFKSSGLNLAKIAELLKQTDDAIQTPPVNEGKLTAVTRIVIAPGVTLDIDREQNQLGEDTLRQLATHISDFLKEDNRDNDDEQAE